VVKGLLQPYTNRYLPPHQKCLPDFSIPTPFTGRDQDV
jgi:hypothetical protein